MSEFSVFGWLLHMLCDNAIVTKGTSYTIRTVSRFDCIIFCGDWFGSNHLACVLMTKYEWPLEKSRCVTARAVSLSNWLSWTSSECLMEDLSLGIVVMGFLTRAISAILFVVCFLWLLFSRPIFQVQYLSSLRRLPSPIPKRCVHIPKTFLTHYIFWVIPGCDRALSLPIPMIPGVRVSAVTSTGETLDFFYNGKWCMNFGSSLVFLGHFFFTTFLGSLESLLRTALLATCIKQIVFQEKHE